MPIVSSSILRVLNRRGGRMVMEQHTDQTGRIWEKRYNTDLTSDENAALPIHAAEIEAKIPGVEAREEAHRAKNGEVTSSANHQNQADLDRQTLGLLMQETDAATFSNALPWFREFEIRAGANNSQRASYLGVDSAEYSLVADRFNQITGIKSGLDADAGRVWDPVPGGWL